MGLLFRYENHLCSKKSNHGQSVELFSRMVKILKATSNWKDDSTNKKNKKKKSKLRPDSIAMKKVQAPKSNPFETIWSRRKFYILGKKRKGEECCLGLSRSLAIHAIQKRRRC